MARTIELALAISITQDNFDEVVKESMDDFGIDKKGATEERLVQHRWVAAPAAERRTQSRCSSSLETRGKRLALATKCTVVLHAI